MQDKRNKYNVIVNLKGNIDFGRVSYGRFKPSAAVSFFCSVCECCFDKVSLSPILSTKISYDLFTVV